MAKPVTNAEIEDVLSSIRRLVSENSGAIKRDRPDEDLNDRLVLTPAFRIDETDDGSADDLDDDPDAAADIADVADWSVPHVAGEEAVEKRPWPAEVLRNQDDDTAAQPDQHATKDPEAIVADVLAQALEPVESQKNSEAEGADGDETLESRIAELEAAVDGSADEWEPDGSEEQVLPDAVILHPRPAKDPAEAQTDDAAPEDATPEAETAETAEAAETAEPVADLPDPTPDAAAEAESDTVSDPDESPDASAPDDLADSGEGLAPKDAAPEPTDATAKPFLAAVGAQVDAPDNAATPDPTPEPVHDEWEDVDIDRRETDEPRGFVTDDDIDDAEVLEEESVIDEAMLQDLVARLVREELQGSVGERITQNVRRMVRREIARAMSLRNVE